jgi:hypothetical protein
MDLQPRTYNETKQIDLVEQGLSVQPNVPVTHPTTRTQDISTSCRFSVVANVPQREAVFCSYTLETG